MGPKGAKRLAIDPTGRLWIINKQGNVYMKRRHRWKRIFGKASSIAIGADNSVFVLGKQIKRQGYAIYKLDRRTNTWQRFPGHAMRIAVHIDGNPWIVSAQKKVFRYTEKGWASVKAPNSRLIVNG